MRVDDFAGVNKNFDCGEQSVAVVQRDSILKFKIFTSLLLLSTLAPMTGVASEAPEIQTTIHQLDSELFDAFNKCADLSQLAKHASFFAKDVEFYHDNGGVTWTRDAMLKNTKQYACGKYTRALVEESFTVSPIKDFGAVSTGIHRFCQTGTNVCEGEANFVMVWRNSGGHWEVTRSLSFGHRPAMHADPSKKSFSGSELSILLEQSNVASASVAFIENGSTTAALAAGDAQIGIPATVSTYYNIASLTKPISAEVALRLVADGKMSLDENMSKYWVDPDIASDVRKNALTPRLALSHRTGFPNWRDGLLKFDRDPGTTFGYSGEGFEYLAKFISKKTKHDIDYWAEQLIFSKNGMRQTSYTGKPWLSANMAFPFDADGKQLLPQISERPVASDNIFSTPSDYAFFVASVMRQMGSEGRLSSERTRIQTDRLAETCNQLKGKNCPTQAGVSLGWEEFVINGARYFMHTGADDGTFTFAYF